MYLDYNATTPVDAAVIAGMLPWFSEQSWNAASAHHGGRVAAQAVEEARGQVASLIGTRKGEIYWTSGASEANNLAIKGVVEASTPAKRRVVTFATEHKAVLDTVGWLASIGSPVTVLPVNRDGLISLDDLEEMLNAGDVALVSLMAANNETGVLSDLAQVVELAHRSGALVHTDATQMVGRLPFDVGDLGVDLVSMSAHKLYGPKGVGALHVAKDVVIAPQIHGGGHERGLRSGTLNVPGIVGFGAAADLALGRMDAEAPRQAELIEHFKTLLMSLVDGVELTTVSPKVLPNTLNIRVKGADAEAVMANAPSVAVSSGSACTALTPEPSHVLRAMGRTDEEALECLRISVGCPTSEQDVETGAELLAGAIQRVRSFN